MFQIQVMILGSIWTSLSSRGLRVTTPEPLGKKSSPTIFYSRELLPLDWVPKTAILGSEISLSSPKSLSRSIILIRDLISLNISVLRKVFYAISILSKNNNKLQNIKTMIILYNTVNPKNYKNCQPPKSIRSKLFIPISFYSYIDMSYNILGDCILMKIYNYNSTLKDQMSMICSQKDLYQLLENKRHSKQEHEQIVKIIINGGYDMPDCLFEHAYFGHKNNPNSDLKYIQLQQIIYSGVQMKMPLNFIRKFYKNLRKSIGDNPYIIRMRKYINYLGSNDINSEIEFKQIENTDFSDTEAKKKIMMICKRKNRMGEYVEYLNKYLEREPMDEEAWIELGELYCERSNFMKAAFCYQELIVLNPSNDNYTLRLAEIYLTENNKANLEKAIKYLSFLISKRPDNLRALWVLYRACGSSKGQEYSELQKMCSDAIHKLYSTRNPSLKFHEAV